MIRRSDDSVPEGDECRAFSFVPFRDSNILSNLFVGRIPTLLHLCLSGTFIFLPNQKPRVCRFVCIARLNSGSTVKVAGIWNVV